MSKASLKTTIPSRSQASSFAGGTGLWAVRSELKPAALSSSISRSSARPIAAAPNGPWLECVLAPRSLNGSPLISSPLAPHSSERMPNVVVTESTTRPCTSNSACA